MHETLEFAKLHRNRNRFGDSDLNSAGIHNLDPEIMQLLYDYMLGDVERKSSEQRGRVGQVNTLPNSTNEYTFYAQNSVKQMLNHLRTKVKLNESQRKEMCI